MPKTPGKIHMYDMVKIDAIVFEIVGGGGAFKAPPPGSFTVGNSPDRIGLTPFDTWKEEEKLNPMQHAFLNGSTNKREF